MIVKLPAWSGVSKRRGMTLVEVVVGIALLAMLLALILASFRSHAAQIRSAKRRMEAIRQADELLSAWTSSGQIPPVGDWGDIPGTSGWTWRIVRATESQELVRLGATSVRLEIVAAREKIEEFPLSSVELLVPRERTSEP